MSDKVEFRNKDVLSKSKWWNNPYGNKTQNMYERFKSYRLNSYFNKMKDKNPFTERQNEFQKSLW